MYVVSQNSFSHFLFSMFYFCVYYYFLWNLYVCMDLNHSVSFFLREKLLFQIKFLPHLEVVTALIDSAQRKGLPPIDSLAINGELHLQINT